MSEGNYRLSINGFTCIAETWDDALNVDGQHDEVMFRVNTRVAKKDGTVVVNSDSPSMLLGDVRGFVGRLQVGSARDWLGSATGGVISGDSYPTPTPWIRNVDLNQKAIADPRLFPPYSIWEGKLSTNDDQVVFVTPTIWEWDAGTGALNGWVNWQKNTDTEFGQRAKDIYGGIWPVAKPFFDAVSLGVQTFATLPTLWGPFGAPMQRPIGLQRDPNNPNGSTFNPAIFALTYDFAEYMFNNDLSGLGRGRFAVKYTDDPHLRGDYTVYLELDKLGGSAKYPNGSVVRESSDPKVYLILGGAKIWVTTPQFLQKYLGGWNAVRVVPDGDLAVEGIGDIPADGVIMREESAAPVWLMENQEKRWITTPSVLGRYGGWTSVRVVPDGSLMNFRQGSNVV